MHNPSLASPDVANYLAAVRQQELRDAARRVKVSDSADTAFGGVRRAMGTLLVRAGTRVAGTGQIAPLTGQPAL